MKVTKEQLVEIISEEIEQALSESLLKEDYVYKKLLMPTQKNPSDSATKCHQGPRDCPPDTSGHFAARTVAGYSGPYWDELISDFKIFWNPTCSGQEGNFEKTQMVHKWVPQLPPDQLKEYACAYKRAFYDGLLAYRDYKAQYYPKDPAIDRIEKAMLAVGGMYDKRPDAISTPQERSLEQEKESKARRAEKASADRFMRGEEPWEPKR